MTDLSKDLRAALSQAFEIRNAEILIRRVSKLDGTVKYLFRMNDGETVESVLMQYKHGYSTVSYTHLIESILTAEKLRVSREENIAERILNHA